MSASITTIHWVVGPQIVGLVMLLAGYIQAKFPPTDIEGLYGYRTPTSKVNQRTFDEGNRFSSMLMIKTGIILLVSGVILSAVIPITYEIWMVISTTFTGIGSAVVLMIKTEKHLEQTFDKNGNEIL